MTTTSTRRFAIGVDYGTSSVRALVVDVDSGEEVGTHVHDYPSGEAGILLDPSDPHLARQNPSDYVEGFLESVGGAVREAARADGFSAETVVGIGVDSTGSTPIPVDASGAPLAWSDGLAGDPAAQAWLWKDHTAWAEAAEISAAAADHADGYLDRCGGTYSSEWYWAKILHCHRTAPEVSAAAHTWVELADFVPAWITGNSHPDRIVRGICAAGHKAMYDEAWGGLPSAAFLGSLDPWLAVLRERYTSRVLASDRRAGLLTGEVARQVGLPAGVPVAVGAFDAHMGAVGAGIGPGTLVKIVGTSTCDIVVAPGDARLPAIPGLCGIVRGSVVPGLYGLEAGQSAVGDIFNWFASQLAPAAYAGDGETHPRLTAAAEALRPGESGLLALDWNNGNRTILVDPMLTGLLVGQTLHTTAPEIYRALVEATAFGALTIIDRFEEYGVAIENVIACGGVAEKSPLVMQVYADVFDRPIAISRSAQTCALGAAVFGAVAGGAHADVASAQARMTGVKPTAYRPRPEAVAVYADLFALYTRLHDAFGGVGAFGGAGDPSADAAASGGPIADIMKRLIAIRDTVRRG